MQSLVTYGGECLVQLKDCVFQGYGEITFFLPLTKGPTAESAISERVLF